MNHQAEPAVVTQPTEPSLAAPATDTQRRYLCRHIHTRGHRCHSPALRGAELCYFHTRARVQTPISTRSGTFSMPRVDDRAGIQLALYDLLCRIAGGDIDLKRAALVLRALEAASRNLTRPHRAEPATPPQVETVTHHHHLGDLAPITEFPTQPEEAAPAAQAPTKTNSTTKPFDPANLFTGIFSIEKKPAAPIEKTPVAQSTPIPAFAVILSEAKDPDTPHPTSPAQTFLPTNSQLSAEDRILPTIQAAAAASIRIPILHARRTHRDTLKLK